ncbi:MAG: RpoL/Rpb11 RNA polymerase subunit family protein [Candidatus Nanohaloarchaea archaeon]
MELDTTEKDGRLLVDMEQNHALANLLRKAVWENDGEAGYDKGHPLGDESVLIIETDNPEETLQEAVDTARDWLDEIKSGL